MKGIKDFVFVVGLFAIALCVVEFTTNGRIPGIIFPDNSSSPAQEPVTMSMLQELQQDQFKYTDAKSEKAARDLEEDLNALYDRILNVEIELQKIEMFSPALNAAEGIYGFSQPIDPKELEELGIDTEEMKEVAKLFE